jgi:glycosyltransferase involved in cell wall biosynthesis
MVGQTRLKAAKRGDAWQGWNEVIILCANRNYDGIKAACRHMATQLSGLTPVLYVDPPVSVLRGDRAMAESIRRPTLRMQAPGLARLTPIVQPGPSRRLATSVTTALVRRQLGQAAAALGCRVRAVISAWPQYPVFGSCREGVRVYWATDDFLGGAELMGLHARSLWARERRVAAGADLVAAVSPVLVQRWASRGVPAILIPNGVDLVAYQDVDRVPRPPDVGLPGRVAGFVGHINARIDLRLLEAVAEEGRSLLLVGPRAASFRSAQFDALVARRNVCWVGSKPFDDLPGYLGLMDVGLLPYGDTPFNRASFPLKVLEYLAAGRGVVATDLPSIRWLETDLVTVTHEPSAFAASVGAALDGPVVPGLAQHRKVFAGQHDWAHRAATMYSAIMARERDSVAVF